MKIIDKIVHKWTKLRLAPIRVFCFHQTSAVFDPSTMTEGDWTEIGQFKRHILALQKEWTFISLAEAHRKLLLASSPLAFRHKKYAALTSDDGWASLKEILPWLIEQRIPITLFLNPGYMDGKHFREKNTEKYLSLEEVRQWISQSNGLITIGMHGWEHICPYEMKQEAFENSVDRSIAYLHKELGYVPYFAFPWGYCNQMNYDVLKDRGITAVFCNGKPNYTFAIGISRDLLDGGDYLKR